MCVPAAKHIVVSGDIHGEFNTLVYKLCVQYKMRDTLLIVAGDCGFGFEKPEYYRSTVRKNSKRMSLANNWIVFVRGNHDNPAYFNGNVFAYKRFIAVPDYAVIQACNKTILGVGGGISIDTVISHTAPSFCEKISKSMVEHFAQSDPTLLKDVQAERETMDAIFHKLIADGHPVSNWFYGHFHQSWNADISGVRFKMLDILEFASIGEV